MSMFASKEDAARYASRPLSDFRVVTFVGSDDDLFATGTKYIVAHEEVKALVDATIALHGDDGGHPCGNRTTKFHEILISTFAPMGPYWWTTPGLKANGDAAGARYMADEVVESAWMSRAKRAYLDRVEGRAETSETETIEVD